jgi:tellurite resistance protein TehA-like permease
MQIDQDARRHSHLYELKPASRWWLLPPLGLVFLSLVLGGFANPVTLGALVGGVGLGFGLILAFPKYWLSRLD